MKRMFKGVATALITPMKGDKVDFESIGRLLDLQIKACVPAAVICGTTGEAPTLGDEEHCEAIDYAVRHAAGRIKIIAGTGSNDTAHAVMMTKRACDMGVDGILTVTPYYNKATQSGLVKSFTAIADASTKPMILYNVPSRTGTSIEPQTYKILADHPNIAGIKEANGNISKIVETFSLVGDKVAIYSGNDDQIVPMLAMGGSGVISVLSNVMPEKTVELCDRFFNGDIEGSAHLQCQLLPLIKALFAQVNPIPVKAAVAAMGLCEETIRLPLVQLEEPYRTELFTQMKNQGII